MATKVYTSGEFKRERDNFLSLCKYYSVYVLGDGDEGVHQRGV